jgi:hypothetical protein
MVMADEWNGRGLSLLLNQNPVIADPCLAIRLPGENARKNLVLRISVCSAYATHPID